MRVLMTSSAERDIWQFTSQLVGQLAEHHAASVLVVVLGRLPSVSQIALLRHRAHPGATVEVQNLDGPLDNEEHAAADQQVAYSFQQPTMRSGSLVPSTARSAALK